MRITNFFKWFSLLSSLFSFLLGLWSCVFITFAGFVIGIIGGALWLAVSAFFNEVLSLNEKLEKIENAITSKDKKDE